MLYTKRKTKSPITELNSKKLKGSLNEAHASAVGLAM